MSSLEEDLRKKFGRLSRPLRDERVSRKSYWENLDYQANVKGFRSNQGGNQELKEAIHSNPDGLQSSESPYTSEIDKNTQNVFDDLIEKLKGLTRSEKEVIQLLWEGKTQAEIAVILNIQRGTVSTFLNRARKKIKKLSSKGRF